MATERITPQDVFPPALLDAEWKEYSEAMTKAKELGVKSSDLFTKEKQHWAEGGEAYAEATRIIIQAEIKLREAIVRKLGNVQYTLTDHKLQIVNGELYARTRV